MSDSDLKVSQLTSGSDSVSFVGTKVGVSFLSVCVCVCVCVCVRACLNENKAKLLTAAHFCSAAQVEFPIRERCAGTVYQRPAAPMHLSVVLQHAQTSPTRGAFSCRPSTHMH